MAINTTSRQTTPYTTGNNFAFAFKVFTAADVKVIQIQTSNSAETILTLNNDYNVTLNNDQNDNPGGSVTLLSGNLATGYNIVITSKVEAKQLTELTNQGGFFPEVINDALDKAVILHQQQQNVIDKTIRFKQTDGITGLEITDAPSVRATKTISFDNNGNVTLIGPVVTTGDTGTISTNMIGDDQVTPAKIGNANIKNLSNCQTNVAASIAGLNNNEVLILDGATVSTTELNVLQGVNNTLTASELNVLDGITASTANLNQLTGKEVETSITANSDAKIPTSKAVNDRILSVTNALGGFVAIANETSFPTTHPDPSENAGTVVSISDAGGVAINNSGVASILNAAGNNTVTITGFPSDLLNQTLGSGVGLQVQTTNTIHEYTYHKVLLKEQDLLNLSNDIDDFGNRYRVVNTTPTSDNDEGDLIFRKSDNKLLVYNGTAFQEASSVGNFYTNTLSSFNGTGGNSATFNGSAYKFNIDHPPELAEQLLVSINGIIQKPNNGSSQPSEGFALSGSSVIFSSAPAAGSSFFIITIGKSVDIGEINDGVVTDVKVASNAQISGSKITPSFGSQNVTTSGNFQCGGGQFTFSNDDGGTIRFLDTNNNPDFNIRSKSAYLQIDQTSNDPIIRVNSNKHVDINYDLDLAGQLIITADIPKIRLIDNNADDDFQISNFSGNFIIKDLTDNLERFRIESDGRTQIFGQLILNNQANYVNSNNGAIFFGTNTAAFWGTNAGIGLASTAHYHITGSNAGDFCIAAKTGENINFGTKSSGSGVTTMSARILADKTFQIFHGNLQLVHDNQKLQIGASQDLQLYHDGSNSYLQDSGTGHLIITTSHLQVKNSGNSELIAKFIEDGAVELNYDHQKKFETTSTGATVTGKVIATDGFEVNDNLGNIYFRNTAATELLGYLRVQTGGADIVTLLAAKNNSEIRLATRANSGNTDLNKIIITADDVRIGRSMVTSNTDVNAIFKHSGGVELYYGVTGQASSKKLETTATGIDVTGTSRLFGNGGAAVKWGDTSDAGHLSFNANGSPVIRAVGGKGIIFEVDQSTTAMTIGSNSDVSLTGSVLSITNNLPILKFIESDTNTASRFIASGSQLYIQAGGNNSGETTSVGQINLTGYHGQEAFAKFIGNGSTEIYYDNVLRLRTTANGVNASGTQHILHSGTSGDCELIIAADSDNNNEGDNPRLIFRQDGNLNLSAIGHNFTGSDASGNKLFIANSVSNGGIEFYTSDTADNYTNGVKRLEITTNGNIQIPANNAKLQIGANQELEIFRSNNHSSILDNLGSSILSIGSHRVNIVNGGNTEVMASFYDNGQAELYFDNVRKLYTQSWGAFVLGSLVANGDLKVNSYIGKIKVGQSDEFTIQHNDTDTIIENTVGNLHIRPKASEEGIKLIPDGAVELFHNNVKTFETTNQGIKVTGTSTNTQVRLVTAGNVLRGYLYANPSNEVYLLDSQAHSFIKGVKDSRVELFFDNVKKLETTSTGVRVNGQLTTVSNVGIGTTSPNINNGYNTLTLNASSNGGVLAFCINDVRKGLIYTESDGDLKLQSESGQQMLFATGGSTNRLQITSTGQVRIPNDGQELAFGGSQDLKIYHSGQQSFIDEVGVGSLYIRNGTDNSVVCNTNAAVELYYDGSKKFETNASGCQVTSTTGAFLDIRSNGTFDAVLQLTANNNNSTDWTIRNDESASNLLDFRFNGTQKASLNSSGTFSVTGKVSENGVTITSKATALSLVFS